MKALVTGGRGFIGSAVATELSRRGRCVVIYDQRPPTISSTSRGFDFVQGDVLDSNRLRSAMAGCEEVYHFSGLLGTSELFDRPHEAIEVNVLGALNVLQAARDLDVGMVLCPNKMNEWRNFYSLTSRAVQDLFFLFQETYGMDTRVLRLLDTYGPGQALFPVRKAVPVFILQAIRGIPLEVFGDGEHEVELVYVKDVAAVVVEFADLDLSDRFPRPFETGFGRRITVNQLAVSVIEACGSSSVVKHVESRRGEEKNTQFSRCTNVAVCLDGFKPTPFKSGLAETIDYYRKLPSAATKAALSFYYD